MAQNPSKTHVELIDRWSKPAMPSPEDVGEEYTGPGADAFQKVGLKNSAEAFDEDRDGYPAKERTRGVFYKSWRAGMELMRSKK